MSWVFVEVIEVTMKLHVAFLGILTAAALLLGGCGKSAPPAEPDYSVLETNVPAAAATATATNAAAQAGATPLERFDAKPGSQVRIEGTSTMHDWQVVGKLIGGHAEVPAKLDLKPGKVDIKAEAFIPVRSMRSITKEGNAYSTKMDDIMYEKLQADKHPRILYRAIEVSLKSAPATPEAAYTLDTKGELVVGGVTNVISMPVQLSRAEDNRVKITGNVAVKMTDFQIKPPAPLGMLIETGDDVKLLFTWVLAPKATPTEGTAP